MNFIVNCYQIKKALTRLGVSQQMTNDWRKPNGVELTF